MEKRTGFHLAIRDSARLVDSFFEFFPPIPALAANACALMAAPGLSVTLRAVKNLIFLSHALVG